MEPTIDPLHKATMIQVTLIELRSLRSLCQFWGFLLLAVIFIGLGLNGYRTFVAGKYAEARADEARQLAVENRKLLQENADLRESCAAQFTNQTIEGE